MRPRKYPFPWTDCQTPIPASSLDPSDLWCQTAVGCDLPFFCNALDRQTDRQTDRPTDRSRESLMTIGRCAPRATRPNNTTLGNRLYAQRKGPNVTNPICLTCNNCSRKCAADCEHCVTQSSTELF